MTKRLVSLATLTLAQCLLVLQPAVGAATPIPDITITSGSASASGSWHNGPSLLGGGAGLSLSGPNISWGFSWDEYGDPFVTQAGATFSGATLNVTPAPGFFGSDVPTGSLILGGINYELSVPGAITTLTSVVVPSQNETVELPAVLLGSGIACYVAPGEPETNGPCSGNPTYTPVTVANVNFDVSGVLTVSFFPEPYGFNTVDFDADFASSPVPEPSSALLLLIAFVGAALWRLRNRLRASLFSAVPFI